MSSIAAFARRRRRGAIVVYTLTVTPNPVAGTNGSTVQLTVMENGVDVTADAGTSYSIANTAVATVDAPTLTSVSPNTITQGASGSYTFTGTNIKGNETIGGLPTGVTASAYSYTSTTVVCTLTATAGASTGGASVTLVASGRGTSGAQTLTVNASGGAGPVLVGSAVQSASGSSVTTPQASPSMNVTAGNLLITMVSGAATTFTPALSDTAGNTWTLVATETTTAGESCAIYYAKNCLGNASNVVTFTDTGSTFKSIVVLQYSGASTTAPLDTSVHNHASGVTSLTSPAFTTTVANEVLVAVAGTHSSAITGIAGMTSRSTTAFTVFDQALTTIQTGATRTAADGSFDYICMIVAAFK